MSSHFLDQVMFLYYVDSCDIIDWISLSICLDNDIETYPDIIISSDILSTVIDSSDIIDMSLAKKLLKDKIVF